MTKENDPRDYVGYDIHGYPFNKKYPPNKKKYRQSFEGYPYKALGVLLYDYCVMGYDVELNYNGESYYLLNAGEGIISGSHFTEHKKFSIVRWLSLKTSRLTARHFLNSHPRLKTSNLSDHSIIL